MMIIIMTKINCNNTDSGNNSESHNVSDDILHAVRKQIKLIKTHIHVPVSGYF